MKAFAVLAVMATVGLLARLAMNHIKHPLGRDFFPDRPGIRTEVDPMKTRRFK